MSIISKCELLVWWQVVVSNINGSQSWVKPHLLGLDVDWRLERSTTVWVVLLPVVLPLWPCSGIKISISLALSRNRCVINHGMVWYVQFWWLILNVSGFFFRNGSGSWISSYFKKKKQRHWATSVGITTENIAFVQITGFSKAKMPRLANQIM